MWPRIPSPVGLDVSGGNIKKEMLYALKYGR